VYGTCKWKRLRRLIAKFHYTDTDTDTDFFVAKLRWVRAGPIRRKKVRVRVRVRVVEFSFYLASRSEVERVTPDFTFWPQVADLHRASVGTL